MSNSLRFMSSAALCLALVVCGSAGVAVASPAPKTQGIDVPMQAAGYDAEIAEANGFKIVTDSDGNQRSVPVTAEAKRIALQQSVGGVTTQATGTLPSCGTAHVYVGQIGSTVIQVDVGYNLIGPVAARHLQVHGAVTSGTYAVSFEGTGGSASWSQVKRLTVGSNLHGYGNLVGGVVLVNGKNCVPSDIHDTW